MKILDLSIENIRGVREEFAFEPKGDNVVIFGPNGTGKSAVVDAIDFLFTGDISRLTGRGTKELSLKDHGKHIDADIKDSFIRATIASNGEKPVVLERHIEKPKILISHEDIDDDLKAAMQIAEKGQHVLSRAEILKYIAAEAGQRSQEIQALLNLDKVESIRKTFVTTSRDADRILQADNSNYEKSKSEVSTVLGLETFSETNVLEKVNESRKTLKGEPIDKLTVEKLKVNISPRATEQKDKVKPELLKNALDAVQKHIEDKGGQIYQAEKNLRETVKTLRENDQLKRDLANKRLLDLGISLIDDSGSCPLCLTKWSPGELDKFLKQRLATAKEAEEIEKQISEYATVIDKDVTILIGHIETLSASAKILKLKEIESDLKEWNESLGKWRDIIRDPTEKCSTDEPADEIKKFLAGNYWDQAQKTLTEKTGSIETASPEQKAWDALTALEPVLKRYFEDKKKWKSSAEFASTAKILSEMYTRTKDQFLANLFTSVNDDFTEYYRFLHGEDENDFQSELKPEGAQLDFKVEFYGRGKHHPRALHSEGHQDSMGLCLYLALNKKISEGKVKLVILDDVVMSIDSGHRKKVCRLLNHFFPDYQFIITTHNRTWARQLCTDGVVKNKNRVEFKGWSVNTGPVYAENKDIWDDLKEKVDKNEISSAAHQLREHLEFYFEGVCDSLRANVCYKSDSRYELGDYLNGAIGKIRKLIKQAKDAANSWNNEEAKSELNEIETQFKEDLLRTQAEQWIINENVHFNKLADSDKNDFLPVVEAFQDFESHFKCSACNENVIVNMRGMTETTLKCPCGQINWNLERKK